MLNLHNWFSDPLSRDSILARARRKSSIGETAQYHPTEVDEAPRSGATGHHIETFFDVLRNGDEAEQSHALSRIVESWRADNAAGGVPVYAHRPLPHNFARGLATIFDTTGAEGKSPTDALASRLGPGTRNAIMQQLAALRPSDDRNRAADRSPLSALGDGDPRAQTLEHRSDRDGPPRYQNLPWSGEAPQAMPTNYGAPTMIPGGSTPPAPTFVPPLGAPSDKVFNPDLNRPPPVADSDLIPAGPLGFARRYRIGNSRVSVPVTDDESDIIAGLNYLNNLRKPDGAPLVPSGTFANNSTGDGVDAIDASGHVVTEGGSPKHYSWDYLRALGGLAREQGETEPTGARFKWRKPSDKANLTPDWFEAQKRFRKGNGSDAIVDPEAYGVADDAEDFADKAQRAANGEEGFNPKLRNAIKRAQETGEPQEVDILLPSSGPLYTARGEVLGLYAIRVRGVVVVKNGRYKIVGRAEVVDAGKFNYDYDGQKNRSLLAKFALGFVARALPDPWDPSRKIASPGRDFSIRANRDADIAIWGSVE